MSKWWKRLIVLSMVAAVFVGLASVADMIMGVPFAGHMAMDIMFLIVAGLIGYMGYETFREAS